MGELRRGRIANLALFSARQTQLMAELAGIAGAHVAASRVLTVSADDGVAVAARTGWRRRGRPVVLECRSFEELGFLRVPVSFREIERQLREGLAAFAKVHGAGAGMLLAVDMSWGLQTPSATANFGSWMAVAEALAAEPGVCVVSLYNRRLLIDEQLLAALRGHPGILTAAGVVANPHWLPAGLMARGTLRQQVDHWLGAIAPGLAEAPPAAVHAAEGADPMWLLRRSAEEPTAADRGARNADSPERWKIRCFGRLRVYRGDGSQVSWEVSGGATRKTEDAVRLPLAEGRARSRHGGAGGPALARGRSAEAARNRLYHTVKCLRDALERGPNSGPDCGRGSTRRGRGGPSCLIRDGSRYVLAPPERSWLDISTFEQLCRQSQGHIAAGAHEEALNCLNAADRLYTGDLFEDIPPAYADDAERDWCWSKRHWLREMLFKVQRDAARIHRARQDYSAALGHCQKALAIDPLCEMAHEEAMEAFHAQGPPRGHRPAVPAVRGGADPLRRPPQSAGLRGCIGGWCGGMGRRDSGAATTRRSNPQGQSCYPLASITTYPGYHHAFHFARALAAITSASCVSSSSTSQSDRLFSGFCGSLNV